MALTGIIALIILGIILLFLEFFVVPGISVFGIAGFIVLGIAIYFSYEGYGLFLGNAILLGTLTTLGISFYIAWRKGLWKKMSLNSAVTAKVNVQKIGLHPGDRGRTISRLAPVGTVEFQNSIFEAGSKGIFIDENTEVEIVSIDSNKIIVKPIK
jgi:membrane-bound ClpP family serine protease